MKKCLSKILSVILTVVMICNAILPCTLSLASDADENYYVQYSGSTDASWGYHPNCTFTVNKIVDNRFKGSFSASNLGTYSFSENVTGRVYQSDDSFTCSFTVKFYNNRYYSSITATVYPYEGYCDCFCAGSWHLEDFTMIGTIIPKDYNTEPSKFDDDKLDYSQKDFDICLNAAANIYDKDFNNDSEIPDLLYNSLLENDFYVDSESTQSSLENFQDSDSNNISYTISYRENEYSTQNQSEIRVADMIVILRGTNADEWSGNTEITGTTYDSEQLTHKNFEQAKNSLKPYINNEYSYLKHTKNYDKVNLIITGHSRGAAVANLYAKDATDNNDTPYFNSVIAYTFATPNVEKYNSDMEEYNNIYNFCIEEDLVPTVPLTNPTTGWNYWKYGHTYNLESNTFGVSNAAIIGIHAAFTKWNSIKKYYEKPLVATNGNTTTLYNTLHDILGIVKTNDNFCRIINSKKVINKFGKYYQLVPLIDSAIINAYSIGKSHSYNHYSQKMKGLSLNDFNEYSYNDSLNDLRYVTNFNSKIFNEAIHNPIPMLLDDLNYNETEVSNLITFANTNSNNDILNWDLNNPKTWNEIVWDDNGNIKEIDFSYLNLSGVLDCSNFSALQSINVYGNNISQIILTNCNSLENLNIADNSIHSIDLSDCENLKSLNCSFNDLSTMSYSIVDSNNTQLESIYCDGCGLSYLDISTQYNLKEISCAFNSLESIDLSENSDISSITCCYNYLDTHEGSALYNTLDDLMFDDVYVNYYPQSVPDNATFNTAELNALKTFANIDSNNSVLDWLDEDGNIDTNKLQNNVLFEYDGSNYRIVAIDISELEITGSLDLTAFAQLKELYCSQTGITSVNVNNCTKLEIIDCSDSQLSMLTLPSNSGDKNTPLYKVMCENNHLDINIFTDDIIKYVTFKAGSQLDYKHQIINASADEFDENDYNALCTFANQKDNLSSLDWDLTAPGEWDYVNWKLDTVSGKYKLLDCYFDCLDITGDIDLSGCTALEYASFSGSDIETAKLPVLTEKLYSASTVETASLGANENAFYDCPKLEAVVISPLAEKIESGAFYNCKALQAVYVPESVISIADNSFGNCPNLTLAGADETTVSEYAFENSISFEEGYFLCARVNCQENTSGTFSAYYPIEDAQIINGDTVCAQTDEYGFFTVFGLEDGQYSYTVSYKFGFNVPLNASISGGCKTVTPPIAMPAFNFNRDGYITMRDYTMLVKITQDSEDFKYYDINRDSVIDNVEKNLFTGLWNMAASDVISYNV